MNINIEYDIPAPSAKFDAKGTLGKVNKLTTRVWRMQ